MTEKREEEEEKEKEEGLLRNVGILNLSNASEEEIEKIKKIHNVGVIIAPKELIGKISAKMIKNVGLIIPYFEGMRIYSGETTLNSDALKNIDKPLDILQTGKLTFAKDVTPELILTKINSFHNYGATLVPSDAHGALMSKCVENMGAIKCLKDEEECKDCEKSN